MPASPTPPIGHASPHPPWVAPAFPASLVGCAYLPPMGHTSLSYPPTGLACPPCGLLHLNVVPIPPTPHRLCIYLSWVMPPTTPPTGHAYPLPLAGCGPPPHLWVVPVPFMGCTCPTTPAMARASHLPLDRPLILSSLLDPPTLKPLASPAF